jgi:hypothetical protein
MSIAPSLEAQPSTTRRRFNLVDSMILTAALALGLVPQGDKYWGQLPEKVQAWRGWIGHI